MTDEKNGQDTDSPPNIRFHVSPDLDYHYRDVFNVYAGLGDVVIEFGNQHRSMPEHVSIFNRIVLSTGNAYILIQTLQQALQQAQMRVQQNLQQQQAAAAGKK